MKRWPIIRHVRALWLAYQLERWRRMWARHGYFLFQESDVEHLRRVWRGEE